MKSCRYLPQIEVLESRDLPASIHVQIDPALVTVTRDDMPTMSYPRQGAITILGTAGNDTITVQLATGVPANITINGNGGIDSVYFTGIDGNNLISASYARTQLTNSLKAWAGTPAVPAPTGLSLLNIHTQQFAAGAGYDVIYFQGSGAADVFKHTSAQDFMTDSHSTITATGFKAVFVNLQRTDTALLYDSPGTDIFVASTTGYSSMHDLYNTYTVSVQGQGYLGLYGTQKGTNLMSLPVRLPYSFASNGFQNLNISSSAGMARVGSSIALGSFNTPGLPHNLQQLSALLDPTLLQATSPYDLALRLRDLVYRSYVVGVTPASFLKQDPATQFVDALLLHTEPVLCQGIQILYGNLLAAWGLPSRVVYMWSANLINGHCSNEIYINGSWIIEDATFNVEVRDDSGQALSYQQLQTASHWHLDTDGYTLRTDQPPLDAYSSLQMYAYYINYATPARPG